ncbi:hypothetical protein CMK21_00905 [Candidatus Poribacteria bacterium]|nr:hypothetical protein [Candidatus Poribacteria bacterium]
MIILLLDDIKNTIIKGKQKEWKIGSGKIKLILKIRKRIKDADWNLFDSNMVVLVAFELKVR